MKIKIKNNQTGFTLIEFIVALVITAIAAAMVYAYMGSMMNRSSDPVVRLQKASNLHRVMENVIADYNRLNKLNIRYKWRSGQSYNVGDIVLPSSGIDNSTSAISNNGRYYKCTTAGTSSGTILPSWPTVAANTTTLGRTVTDGTVVWTEQGYVRKASQQYPANAIIIPKQNNGHFYKGPNSPFTAGSTADDNVSWPTTTSGTVSDGTITWTEVGTILDRSSTSLTDAILLDSIKYYLDTYLTTNVGRYGTGYAVVTAETKFVKFSSATPAVEQDATSTDEKNILKVTIQDSTTGETLTELFTIR